jgi:F-type H+-transporting ATPase subunit b
VCGTALATATLGLPSWLSATEANHGEQHGAGIGDILFPAINFTIFAAILARYLVPAVREYLRRRREDVVAAIEQSRVALAAAERAIATAKQRRAALAAASESVRQDLAAAALRQTDRGRAQAEESAKRRLADAVLVAEQERQRALESVRAEIAALAIEIAERRILGAVSPDDQRRFVQQFLKDAPSR